MRKPSNVAVFVALQWIRVAVGAAFYNPFSTSEVPPNWATSGWQVPTSVNYFPPGAGFPFGQNPVPQVVIVVQTFTGSQPFAGGPAVVPKPAFDSNETLVPPTVPWRPISSTTSTTPAPSNPDEDDDEPQGPNVIDDGEHVANPPKTANGTEFANSGGESGDNGEGEIEFPVIESDTPGVAAKPAFGEEGNLNTPNITDNAVKVKKVLKLTRKRKLYPNRYKVTGVAVPWGANPLYPTESSQSSFQYPYDSKDYSASIPHTPYENFLRSKAINRAGTHGVLTHNISPYYPTAHSETFYNHNRGPSVLSPGSQIPLGHPFSPFVSYGPQNYPINLYKS